MFGFDRSQVSRGRGLSRCSARHDQDRESMIPPKLGVALAVYCCPWFFVSSLVLHLFSPEASTFFTDNRLGCNICENKNQPKTAEGERATGRELSGCLTRVIHCWDFFGGKSSKYSWMCFKFAIVHLRCPMMESTAKSLFKNWISSITKFPRGF